MATRPRPTPSRIAARRRELGLWQEDLSEATGVSLRTISRAENGYAPSLAALVNIAIALEVPLTEILQPEWLDTWSEFTRSGGSQERPQPGWWRELEREAGSDQAQPRPERARRSRRQVSDWMGHSGGAARQAPRHQAD